MWVVVTHIINPSHFYVRYVAEKRENEALSRKINKFCHLDTSHFTLIDTLETGINVLHFPYCYEAYFMLQLKLWSVLFLKV